MKVSSLTDIMSGFESWVWIGKKEHHYLLQSQGEGCVWNGKSVWAGREGFGKERESEREGGTCVTHVHLLVLFRTCGNMVDREFFWHSASVHLSVLSELAPAAFLRTHFVTRSASILLLCDFKYVTFTLTALCYVFEHIICSCNYYADRRDLGGYSFGFVRKSMRSLERCIVRLSSCMCAGTSRSRVRSRDNWVSVL